MCLMEPECPGRSQTCFLHPLSNMWLFTSTPSSPQLSECNSVFTGDEITSTPLHCIFPQLHHHPGVPRAMCSPLRLPHTAPAVKQQFQQAGQELKFSLVHTQPQFLSLAHPHLDSALVQSSAKWCCLKLKGDKYFTKKPKKILYLSWGLFFLLNQITRLIIYCKSLATQRTKGSLFCSVWT